MAFNLELRNIKYMASLSEETNAYSATVYLNGKAVCDVSNHGQGGCDEQYWKDRDAEAKIADYLAANVSDSWKNYPWSSGGAPKYDLEAWCGEKVDAFLLDKQVRETYRRAAKGAILYKEEGRDGVFHIKWKGHKAPWTPKHYQVVRERHPTATILNELPEAKALEIWRREVVR